MPFGQVTRRLPVLIANPKDAGAVPVTVFGGRDQLAGAVFS
jgi:hypothetical protein